ncbi:MAG: winged helix-turn-helix domain-containing protein [Calditrichia bacterium]
MSNTFQLGKWLVKPDSNELVSENQTQQLEHIVMQLLVYFTENSCRNLSKDEILKGVWGDGIHSEEVLTVAVSNLRKALGDSAHKPRYIKTLHRFGYRMLLQPLPAETVEANNHRSLLSQLEQRVGLRFLVISVIVALFLTVLLVQVAVEVLVLISRW